MSSVLYSIASRLRYNSFEETPAMCFRLSPLLTCGSANG